MKQRWSRYLAIVLLLHAACGCASFWEEVLSHERDWAYITGRGKPHPLVVIRDNPDGARRAQALSELKEPLRNGGNAKDQEAYLKILGTAAREDREPLCRLTAIRALGKFHDPRAARLLEEVYQQQKLPFTPDNNSLIRKESLVALEMMHDPDARHLLIRVARQPGPASESSLSDRQQTQDEKIVAIRALGKYKEPECAEALAYVLRTEKDIALRDRALQSMEESTGKKWPASYAEWQKEGGNPQPLAVREPSMLQRVSGVFK